MGSVQSTTENTDEHPEEIEDVIEKDPNVPHFNEAQKKSLRDSWSKLHSKMDAIGVVVFLRLIIRDH